MIEIIKFEVKGIFKRKKNIFSILILIILLFCFTFLLATFETKKASSNMSVDASNIKSLEESLKQAEYLADKYKDDKASAGKLKSQVDDTNLEISLSKGLLNAKKSGDWHEELNLTVKLDELTLKHANSPDYYVGISIEELNKSINKNKFLLSNNIKPIEESSTLNGYNFIRLAMVEILPLLLPIFLLIICSDMISKEFDEGTYKILFTQPISRKKILLSKYIANSILTIIATFLILFVFFIVIGLIRGFGDPSYPIECLSNNKLFFAEIINIDGCTFIGLRDFVLLSSLLCILFIILLTAFAMLISVIFENSSASISFSILIYVVIYIFNSRMNLFKSFAHLLPFTYSNIPKLLDGTTMNMISNKSITAGFSILIFLSYTMIFYIISSLIINKRDMIG